MIVGPDNKPIKGTQDGTSKPPIVIGAFLVYNSIQAPTFECAMNIAGSGCLAGWIVVQSVILPTARNLAFQQISEHFPDYEYILFMDHDMAGISEVHIAKLVKTMRDNPDIGVIAPLMVRRNPPFSPVCNPIDSNGNGVAQLLFDELNKSDPGFIECEHVGTGVMLVRREVIENTAIEVNNCEDPHKEWFTMDRYPYTWHPDEDIKRLQELYLKELYNNDNNDNGDRLFNNKDFVKRLYEASLEEFYSHDMRGEDVFFCNRVRDKGYKVYVHCGVQIAHLGHFPFHIGHHIQEMQNEGKIKVTPKEMS